MEDVLKQIQQARVTELKFSYYLTQRFLSDKPAAVVLSGVEAEIEAVLGRDEDVTVSQIRLTDEEQRNFAILCQGIVDRVKQGEAVVALRVTTPPWRHTNNTWRTTWASDGTNTSG